MSAVKMSDYLEFDPAIIEKRQVYRLLTGAVVPLPIGWASTLSSGGISNLAPFSFFTVVCVIPPMISLTIARNTDGTEKHTLKVRATGEFCFNVVTDQVWREMVDSANAFPADDSEFSKTGLTPILASKSRRRASKKFRSISSVNWNASLSLTRTGNR
jgi:flavin reductase (DIM6/NTAB) family NADH-FMN oxidoreductase RutF